MNKHKGFTLIELLVVIAIIGLLAAVVMVNLNTARGKANYAKAISEMKEIETASNMYFSDNGFYAPDVGPDTNPGFTSLKEWPKPPCSGWTYDWENWNPQYGGSNYAHPTLRVTLRRPDVSPVYYYCIENSEATCDADATGGADIKLVKALTCKE